jgi:hypothetical protein
LTDQLYRPASASLGPAIAVEHSPGHRDLRAIASWRSSRQPRLLGPWRTSSQMPHRSDRTASDVDLARFDLRIIRAMQSPGRPGLRFANPIGGGASWLVREARHSLPALPPAGAREAPHSGTEPERDWCRLQHRPPHGTQSAAGQAAGEGVGACLPPITSVTGTPSPGPCAGVQAQHVDSLTLRIDTITAPQRCSFRAS